MKIDQLGADEFLEAVALIADGINGIRDSDSFQTLCKAVAACRASLADVPEEERKQKAASEMMGIIVCNLPALCRENGDSFYQIVASCCGMSLEEYKEGFTFTGMIADIKEIVTWASDNLDLVNAFLA